MGGWNNSTTISEWLKWRTVLEEIHTAQMGSTTGHALSMTSAVAEARRADVFAQSSMTFGPCYQYGEGVSTSVYAEQRALVGSTAAFDKALVAAAPATTNSTAVLKTAKTLVEAGYSVDLVASWAACGITTT